MQLTEAFFNPFIAIIFYYTGMVLWIGMIYQSRDTYNMLADIYYEYKYDNGVLNKHPKHVIHIFNSAKKNIINMTLTNIVASVFSGVFLVFLKIELFILLSVPLIFMLFCLLVLMGTFNNKTSADVHKSKTLLG